MVAGVRDFNRPVHLARRDAYVERAVELVYMPLQKVNTQQRLQQVDFITRLIEGARKHAILAMRANRVTEEERAFERFLTLIHENARSIHALMLNQSHLESEGRAFMGLLLDEEEEEALLSAFHCRRSAEDMLMGLAQILRLAHGPYRTLQRRNVDSLENGEGDRERYRQAHRSFHLELRDKYPSQGFAPSETVKVKETA